MPFYLGFPANDAQTVSEPLRNRGIDMLRASPSDIKVLVKIHINQPAFVVYVNNLPAFMEANQNRAIVSLAKEGYPINLPVNLCFPFRYPALMIESKVTLSQDKLDKLAEIGYRNIAHQNKTSMVFDNYTLDDVHYIRSLKPIATCRATVNTINLDCMSSLITVIRIFSSFFRTHTYPAFKTDEDVAFLMEDFDSILEQGSLKRKRAEVDVGGEGRSQRREEGETEGEDSTGEDIRPTLLKDRVKIYRAKPQPVEDNVWGDLTKIPNAHGILCPFVPDLTRYDRDMVPDIILSKFISCLGPTFTEQSGNFDRIKSAWGIIHQTDAGDVLAHMGFMIDIACRSQSRVYPLFENGSYVGSVLSGCAFSLKANGVVYRPSSYEQLQTDIEIVKFHSSALRSIAHYVDDMGRQEVLEADSMRKLANFLKTRELTEDAKDAIKREASYLSFPVKYWAINSTTICKILDLLSDTGKPIPDDVPLHPSYIFDNDRVASALAAFGYTAPTLMIPSCPIFKLVGNAVPPKTFVVRAVELSTAIADWKMVLKSKSITNGPANLSSKYRDRSISGGEKAKVWQKLKEVVKVDTAAGGDILGPLEEELNSTSVGGFDMDDF